MRFRLLVLAVMGLLMLAVGLASMASAATTVLLPESEVSMKASGLGEVAFKEEGTFTELTCKESSGEGTMLKKLSPSEWTIIFKLCLTSFLGLQLCTGLANSANSSEVTIKATAHLKKHKTGVAVVLLLLPVHFECQPANILFEVKGCIAGLITPINKKIKTTEHATLTFKQTGGLQEILKVLNDAETAEEECKMEAKEGTGAFKPAGETATEDVTATVETEIMG
jgi:hypothetical protein